MAELLGDIGNDPVDMLLETNGGQTDPTEALVTLIQNVVPDFRRDRRERCQKQWDPAWFGGKCDRNGRDLGARAG